MDDHKLLQSSGHGSGGGRQAITITNTDLTGIGIATVGKVPTETEEIGLTGDTIREANTQEGAAN